MPAVVALAPLPRASRTPVVAAVVVVEDHVELERIDRGIVGDPGGEPLVKPRLFGEQMIWSLEGAARTGGRFGGAHAVHAEVADLPADVVFAVGAVKQSRSAPDRALQVARHDLRCGRGGPAHDNRPIDRGVVPLQKERVEDGVGSLILHVGGFVGR